MVTAKVNAIKTKQCYYVLYGYRCLQRAMGVNSILSEFKRGHLKVQERVN